MDDKENRTLGLFSVLVPGAGLIALAGEVVFAVAMLETCSYAKSDRLGKLTHWTGFGGHLGYSKMYRGSLRRVYV